MHKVNPELLKVIHDAESGEKHATDGVHVLTVLPDAVNTNTFLRRAIKVPLTKEEPTHEVAWLVGELNGVRVYVTGVHIIMTTQDLNP